jgi:ATP-binding cassette subfamily C (CFTR/MRP) protein 1
VPLRLRLKWALSSSSSREEKELEWRTTSGRKKAQLYLAIVEQFRPYYFPAVPFKIVGDTCQLMVRHYLSFDIQAEGAQTPLLAKAIIVYAQEKATAKADGIPGPGVGRGIGMSLGMCGSILPVA